MLYRLITIKDRRSIILLSQKGFSVRQISREVQLSPNTVATYLERFKASSFTGQELLKMDDVGFSRIAYVLCNNCSRNFKSTTSFPGYNIFFHNLNAPVLRDICFGNNIKGNIQTVIAMRTFVTCLHCIKKLMKLPFILSISS